MTSRTSTAVDRVLDRSVVLGFSKIGHALRRRLPDHPADPTPDAMRGRHVVVTGASSGLGMATAEGLARLGADVHLVVRDPAKGQGVVDRIREDVPGARLHLHRCDVSDLDDVRRCAAELAEQIDSLAALVHNAGAMPPKRTESAQGHEMTMSLHVLGPLVMTEALLPALEAGHGRVVMVTSGGMYTQSLPVRDPEYLRGEYKPPVAYARSKRVQVSLLPVLAERWGSRGVTVHAMHPGWADTPGVVDSLPGFHRLTGPILRDAEQGADTSVWLCAADPTPPSGLLWHDRRPRSAHFTRRTQETGEDRERIWSWVREAAGLDT
jgi:NAD(P)-dependent dehydrogenase (short-subunit alcohol dehydrogenase family)